MGNRSSSYQHHSVLHLSLIDNKNSTNSSPSFDILPDEMQTKILSHLQPDDALRCKSVCKKWRTTINALARSPPMDDAPKEPFYFMYNSRKPYLARFAYKSGKRRWIPFVIPDFNVNWPAPPLDLPIYNRNPYRLSASNGLLCFMNATYQDSIFVCNPVLKDEIRLLPGVPGARADYCGLAISTNVSSRKYAVALVKSSEVDAVDFVYNVNIHFYESETRSWVHLHSESLTGWRGDEVCVISNGILYCVVQCHYVPGDIQPHHAIVSYDLSQSRIDQSLSSTLVSLPCPLTCVKLVNLSDKLIMVGGIRKHGTSKFENIGIWELCRNKYWKKIAVAPPHVMKGFCEAINEEFISTGCGNLVFIQIERLRALLIFDLCKNIWTFAPKPPLSMEKIDHFTGFCFEPRLDILTWM